jgi:hypothetical protein
MCRTFLCSQTVFSQTVFAQAAFSQSPSHRVRAKRTARTGQG